MERVDRKMIPAKSGSLMAKPDKALSPGNISTFLWEAFTIDKWRDIDLEILVHRAAQGLIEEGARLGHQLEAEEMSKRMLKVQKGTREEIWFHCVHLYTMESFLYKRVNPMGTGDVYIRPASNQLIVDLHISLKMFL